MASGYSNGSGGAITDWGAMERVLAGESATETCLRQRLVELADKARQHPDWPIGREILAWAEGRIADLDALAVKS